MQPKIDEKLQFAVRSDLVQIGTNFEDGEPLIRATFYVVARAEDGRQWKHNHTFCTTQGCDPEGDLAKAELLCGRIEEQGVIDLQHWNEIDPSYGSRAYIDQGIEEQRWMEERMEAGFF